MANTLLAVAAQEGPAVWFVCLLGIGVVFVGLVCIIGIVSVMNLIFNFAENRKKDKQQIISQAATVPQTKKEEKIENRQEVIAAVCAAVAEENGTDISAIRIVSFKKL